MRKNIETRKKQEKGFILIMSYLLLTALSIFSLGLFARGSVFLKTAERNKKKIMAFNAAEAGFDDAFYRVKNNSITSYPWSSGYVSLNSAGYEGGYSTLVTDMGGDVRRITVTGYSPNQTTTSEVLEARPITGYVQPVPSGLFNFGVFAVDQIDFNGNNPTIDSYNSDDGVYGGTNIFANGDIGTDATGDGVIDIGNANINGDAVVGPGGDTEAGVVIGNNGTLTGAVSAATQEQAPEAPEAPENLASSGTISLSKGTLTLAAGTYLYDSIKISGKGKISATGAVTIYVTGQIDIGGNGIATADNKPTNMLIFVTGADDIKLSGNGNLYAGIYAPNSEVTNTGNGTLYGAVVCEQYQQSGNGNVHFDEALKDIEGGSSDELQVLSWQESNITAQSTSSSTTLNH